MGIQYTAEKDDLFYPAKNAAFFPNGRPRSDAALCVELCRLAYCELGSATACCFAFDRDRINKVLGRIGFTDCRFFEVATASDGRGSHGFLATDSKAGLAVLCFRGTDKDDPTDLMDDFNAAPKPWQGGGNVHSGFAGALLELWNGEDGIDAALHAPGTARLLITGHSLGAAMATLAANLHKPDALYTFGCPRVGDVAFVEDMAGVVNFRYVDCCDVVARIPPQDVLGYKHIPGDIRYIFADRHVETTDPSDARIEADRIRGAADYLCDYAWRSGDVAVRDLADHAPANYVWPVSAATA